MPTFTDRRYRKFEPGDLVYSACSHMVRDYTFDREDICLVVEKFLKPHSYKYYYRMWASRLEKMVTYTEEDMMFFNHVVDE